MQFAFDGISLAIGGLLGAAGAAVWLWAAAARAATRAAAERGALIAHIDLRGRIERELREGVAERDRQVAHLQAELAASREKQAELVTTLDKERVAARDKLALLESAQAQLSDAFQALDPAKPEHKAILELQRAARFIPTQASNYEGIEAAAKSAGLLK